MESVKLGIKDKEGNKKPLYEGEPVAYVENTLGHKLDHRKFGYLMGFHYKKANELKYYKRFIEKAFNQSDSKVNKAFATYELKKIINCRLTQPTLAELDQKANVNSSEEKSD
ncbi:hypothetical protein [Parashewanella spongiae]|uniref:hypothetical protein n=1 Tax=Parashewanella spongiae TaxID=342950 RepID=UPI0011AEBAF8|nr:hypothetical protein [Parashewanella spongiae]